MTYGPIESSFDVYDDFISYKSGINSILIKKIIICIQQFVWLLVYKSIFNYLIGILIYQKIFDCILNDILRYLLVHFEYKIFGIYLKPNDHHKSNNKLNYLF